MATPNKHLVTLLFNRIIKPDFDWIKGMFVDNFEIKTEKNFFNPITQAWSYIPVVYMKFRIFVDFNIEDIKDYNDFEQKVEGDAKKLSELLSNPKTYRYIGLNTLYSNSFKNENISFDLIDDEMEQKSEIEERIINIFPKKSPPTSLGMF